MYILFVITTHYNDTIAKIFFYTFGHLSSHKKVLTKRGSMNGSINTLSPIKYLPMRLTA